MLEEAQKLRTPQMHAALALDLNTGLRDKELREIRWEQIDLIRKKSLTVGKSKTEAGTGRVIPLNDTAVAALEAHAGLLILIPPKKCGTVAGNSSTRSPWRSEPRAHQSAAPHFAPGAQSRLQFH
jgi:integrase